MSDGADPDRSGGSEGDVDPDVSTVPAPVRRHLIVLGLALVGLVVGIVLVLTGRSDQGTGTPPATTTATVAAPLLEDLGSVSSRAAAIALLERLDPTNLVAGAPTTRRTTSSVRSAPGVELTEAGLQRCQGAIAQQTTDRSLGKRIASGRLQVGRSAAFVVSYELPASGSSAAARRIVLVDARTCRVLGAVQHP